MNNYVICPEFKNLPDKQHVLEAYFSLHTVSF